MQITPRICIKSRAMRDSDGNYYPRATSRFAGKTKVMFSCSMKDRVERISDPVMYVRREMAIITLCANLLAQCIVIAHVCLCVGLWVCLCMCLWVCYHDNSKLCASILTKLGL